MTTECPSVAADRHFDSEEKQAVSAHFAWLAKAHQRLMAIEAERNNLRKEERDLQREILQRIGLEKDAVVTDTSGRNGQIVRIERFLWARHPLRDKLVAAGAFVELARPTSTGFHKRARDHHVAVVDEAGYFDPSEFGEAP